MTKQVADTLIDAIGEEAAQRALYALNEEAEKIREGRPNCRTLILFDPDGGAQWAKAVSGYTRTTDEDDP